MRLSQLEFKNSMKKTGFEVTFKQEGGCYGIKRGRIKGSSGCMFSPAHYYINTDNFIVCRLGGFVVDMAVR